MTTQTADARTIRAKIDPDAISKVASFFDASITDIINEMLQNARRAGAQRVDINWNPDDSVITLADDGSGISDPQAILSFGGSNWNRESVDRERPAGMGFYSLARRPHVRVVSKEEGTDGWAVELTPEHFGGIESAEVREAEWNGHLTHGTAVSFTWAHDPTEPIRKAARFYPQPVFYNGDRQDRDDFLEGALSVTEWRGLHIGVHHRQSGWAYPNSHGRCINFHGIEVSAYQHLPEVTTVTRGRTDLVARVDVIDCAHLELTLPARKELVETPFLEELRERCMLAIYETIAAAEEPVDVAHSVQQEARKRGVAIADARARLKPWRCPTEWRGGNTDKDPKRQDLPDGAMIVEGAFERQMEHTLARAAQLNGLDDVLMDSERHNMSGYPWYDALPAICEIRAMAHQGDTVTELWPEDEDHSEWKTLDGRPDRIELILEVRHADGQISEMKLETDFALPDPEEEFIDDVSPLVTVGSDMDPTELSDLLMAAYFRPNEDHGSDSYDTQEEGAARAANEVATATLHSKEEAFRLAVVEALSRAGITALPVGSTVKATIGPGKTFDMVIKRAGETEGAR